MTLELDDYVRAVREEGEAFAAAAGGSLGAAVPSCPGWDVRELVWHLREVHRFWNEIAAGGLLDPEEVPLRDRPDDKDLLPWFEQGLGDLVRTLESSDPEAPVWSWISTEPVPTAWIHRRMAQETATHRWDAQDAVGRREAIPPPLAVDGIEEFLYAFVGFDPSRLEEGGETVSLRATDTGHGWVVRVGDGHLAVRPTEHAEVLGAVDAEAAGSASDLLLLLWRRLRQNAVDVRGDPAALARFLRRANLN
jgi:uncharacterized protein (TIGR03083 family)